MKQVGLIKEFNGNYGKVLNMEGIEYIIIKKDVMDTNILPNDKVTFVPDNYETPEYKEKIARFVKKLNK